MQWEKIEKHIPDNKIQEVKKLFEEILAIKSLETEEIFTFLSSELWEAFSFEQIERKKNKNKGMENAWNNW